MLVSGKQVVHVALLFGDAVSVCYAFGHMKCYSLVITTRYIICAPWLWRNY